MHSTSICGLRCREVKQVAGLICSVVDRRSIRLGIGMMMVAMSSGGLAALSPLALKSLVDAVAASKQVFAYGTAYLFLLLVTRGFTDVRPLLAGAISERLHSQLAERFHKQVLRLPLRYLHRRRSGELLHSLDLASMGVQLLINHLIGGLLPVLVELVAMIVVLARLGQPSLIAILSMSTLAYIITFSAGARRMIKLSHDVSTSSLEVHAQLTDAVVHVETLRYFTAEATASQRLHSAAANLERSWMHMNRLNFIVALIASTIFALSMAACLLIGANAVASHAMTIGGFVLTTVYTLQMVRPLESLGTAARDLSRALGYLRPLLDLLSEPLSETSKLVPDSTHAHAIRKHRAASVQFENVHFGYDAERPILKGFDLKVRSGSTTAIVGRSGSGKSSLARLLMRLYTPQQGCILLDGRPIDSIDAAELRGTLIGFVPQETALLHDTIAGNIALGSPAATRDDIHAAAGAAQLAELADALPQGLDTAVGERGMQLSGGERQRVGIARALLRQPSVYLLDEPTSMLDSRTEREIQEALRSITAGTTTIIIAHRLSTIVTADEIVVLDDGRIQERGTHHALLAQNGLYARMWRQQALSVHKD